MTYLVNPRPRAKRPGVMSTDELSVRFPEIMRSTGRLIGGLFREVEGHGVNEQALQVTARDARDADGRKGYAGWGNVTIPRSADAVHKHIRRLRDDDDVAILAIDAEIEGYKLKIAEARKRRAEAVKRAWQRGEDVPLRELVDLVESKGVRT